MSKNLIKEKGGVSVLSPFTIFYRVSVALYLGVFISTAVVAEEDISHCNCMVVVGSCEPNIGLQAGKVIVRSSSPQCSKVMWFANETPYITTVIGGVAEEEWESEDIPELKVESCQVCEDSLAEIAEFKEGAEGQFYRYTDPRTGSLRYLELPPANDSGERKLVIP